MTMWNQNVERARADEIIESIVPIVKMVKLSDGPNIKIYCKFEGILVQTFISEADSINEDKIRRIVIGLLDSVFKERLKGDSYGNEAGNGRKTDEPNEQAENQSRGSGRNKA